MATKVFRQLELPIQQIKHKTFEDGTKVWVEDTYEDANGDRAVIIRPKGQEA